MKPLGSKIKERCGDWVRTLQVVGYNSSNPLEGDKLNIEPQENFVDACVEMIEKLHELNLL